MLGQGRSHPGTEMVRNGKHIFIRPPALVEGQQLVLEVLDLLTRESRYGKSALKALPRWAVAGAAKLYFGLNLLRCNGGFLSPSRGKSHCQDCSW